MDYNKFYYANRPRQGGQPVWVDKHPELYQLMESSGLRQYDIALICNMHPDSLSRKLRTTMTTAEEQKIITTIKTYLREHSND